MRRAALLLVLAACKKDEPKPPPEPAAQVVEPSPAPTLDAPEPAGQAAARIAPDVPARKLEQGHAAVAGLDAVEACSAPAPRPDRGRMTRRPRNPANQVTGWQEEALAHFESLVAAGATLDGAVFARTLDEGKVGYAAPLVIVEACLTCHGEGATSPDDRANGYRLGDLRGLAWAELR